MPDSFPPPTWGPPFDERDLDALLSGDTADTPLALRQVADALSALRTAPTPAELSGEAVARAEFRAAGLGEAARTDGPAHTLMLPARAPDRPGRRPARHRSVRGAGHARPQGARPPGRRFGRRGGLIAAAATALIVTVIAVAGSLSGPMHHTGNSSAAGTPSAGHSSTGGSPSQNVQAGSATPEPTHHATPAHSASQTPSNPSLTPQQTQARSLCREFYGYFLDPQPHVKLSAEERLYWEIAKLAGSPSRFDMNSFCGPDVSDMFAHGVLPAPWSPGGGPITPLGGQNGPGDTNQGTGPGVGNGAPGQVK